MPRSTREPADRQPHNYPEPFQRVVAGRERKRLGNAAGLDQFGVNLTPLKPGAARRCGTGTRRKMSLSIVLEGEAGADRGRRRDRCSSAGDAAGFKAGVPNGHHLVNRSERDAVYLEIGTRSKHERAEYPDVDLRIIRDDASAHVHAQDRQALSHAT